MYASGRWHTRGHPVVYTGGSRSLAILEKLVHTDTEDLPDDQVLITVQIPDEIAIDTIPLNPLHPDAGKITIRDIRPFHFDERPVDPGKR